MLNSPAITVVIPHKNRSNYLKPCLAALHRQSMDPKEFEVIVVDDHSLADEAEAARQMADHYRATLVVNPKQPGSAAQARNTGLAMAQGELILFLDGDCVAHPDLLARLADAPRDSLTVDFVSLTGAAYSLQTMPFVAADPSQQSKVPAYESILWSSEPLLIDPRFGFVEQAAPDLDGHPAPWVFAWSGSLLLNTAVARSVHGFDERYDAKGSEDMAFGYELSRAGATFRMLHDLPPVIHLAHTRHRSAEERKDRIHERFFLKVHPRFEVEMLCAFDASNTGSAIRHLDFLRKEPFFKHAQKDAGARLALERPLCLLGAGNEAWREAWRPDYSLDPVFSGAETDRQFSLIGLAMPFEDQELGSILIPDLRYTFPEPLICSIFQEAFRVARKVVYAREFRPAPLPPLAEPATRLFDRPYWERSFYRSRSYFDWTLKPTARGDKISFCELHPAAGSRCCDPSNSLEPGPRS